jgi:CheY-like chemotaxis protein
MTHEYVLVVDDDDDIRETIADALVDCGITVQQAADGAAALARMRTAVPCMVLLDLMMPVMDGWEVVREMRHDPVLAAVPVCVLSALTANRAPPEATRVLRKPARLAAILETIGEHCRSAQPAG